VSIHAFLISYELYDIEARKEEEGRKRKTYQIERRTENGGR